MSLVVPFDEIFNDEGLLSKHSSWKHVELGSVCRVVNGFAFPSKNFNRDKGVPVVRIRDLERNHTETRYNGSVPREVMVRDGDLLIGMDGIFRCVEWRGGNAGLNQRVCKIVPDKRFLLSKFLLFGINGYLKAIQDATSSVTVGHLSSRDVLKIPFPLAPLNEQRRIVAKLENLLGKVDISQHRLAKIPVLLRRFRQSVLAAACSGRLTADWRGKIGTTHDEWQRTSVKDVTEKIEYGYTASAKKGGSGPRFLRITDIQQGRVSWDDVPTCDISATLSKKYALKSGDIVFARTGATTGKSFLIRKCPAAVFASYLIRVQASSEVLPAFLHLFFQTPAYWEAISENLAGNAQPNCNATKLGQLQFDLPPLAEQQEIVHRIEALLALADQIEARCAKAKAHVEKLTQSILTKAFRGELVPQDPNDEPASILLERIRSAVTTPKADSVRPARYRL